MVFSLAGIAAAVFYGVTSGSMAFVNKVVLTSYSFPHTNVLMLVQVAVTAFVLELFRWTKCLHMPQYNLERAKLLLIPSLCYTVHTAFALMALSHLSIPMYNVLRRLVPLMSLILAYIVLKQRPSSMVIFSVLLTVGGCLIAGLGDMAFSLPAYLHGLASCLTQAVYLTYVQKTGAESGLSALSVVHLSSINCLPFLAVYTVLSSEVQEVLKYPKLYDIHFLGAFALAVTLGCVLNYSMFLCATLNSALTVSLVGVVKSIITTVVGFFTFGGVAPTPLTLIGITVNTVGAVSYAWAKYTEKQAKLSNKQSPLQEEKSIEKEELPPMKA